MKYNNKKITFTGLSQSNDEADAATKLRDISEMLFDTRDFFDIYNGSKPVSNIELAKILSDLQEKGALYMKDKKLFFKRSARNKSNAKLELKEIKSILGIEELSSLDDLRKKLIHYILIMLFRTKKFESFCQLASPYLDIKTVTENYFLSKDDPKYTTMTSYLESLKNIYFDQFNIQLLNAESFSDELDSLSVSLDALNLMNDKMNAFKQILSGIIVVLEKHLNIKSNSAVLKKLKSSIVLFDALRSNPEIIGLKNVNGIINNVNKLVEIQILLMMMFQSKIDDCMDEFTLENKDNKKKISALEDANKNLGLVRQRSEQYWQESCSDLGYKCQPGVCCGGRGWKTRTITERILSKAEIITQKENFAEIHILRDCLQSNKEKIKLLKSCEQSFPLNMRENIIINSEPLVQNIVEQHLKSCIKEFDQINVLLNDFVKSRKTTKAEKQERYSPHNIMSTMENMESYFKATDECLIDVQKCFIDVQKCFIVAQKNINIMESLAAFLYHKLTVKNTLNSKYQYFANQPEMKLALIQYILHLPNDEQSRALKLALDKDVNLNKCLKNSEKFFLLTKLQKDNKKRVIPPVLAKVTDGGGMTQLFETEDTVYTVEAEQGVLGSYDPPELVQTLVPDTEEIVKSHYGVLDSYNPPVYEQSFVPQQASFYAPSAPPYQPPVPQASFYQPSQAYNPQLFQVAIPRERPLVPAHQQSVPQQASFYAPSAPPYQPPVSQASNYQPSPVYNPQLFQVTAPYDTIDKIRQLAMLPVEQGAVVSAPVQDERQQEAAGYQ